MLLSMFKSVFKTSLIGTAVLGTLAGGALIAAGPGRAKAVVGEVRSRVSQAIDARLDDPISLRNKLRDLEREYPQRIAGLRGDLSELEAQISQLERERAISERVVQLADEDLAVLRPRLEEAAQGAASESGDQVRLAAIAFDDQVYSLRRAASKVKQIENTRSAHATRADDAQHSLTYLRTQAVRFEETIAQLESEQAEFQVQLAQLNRQVDSIQRNERLIDMLAERKKTLDECASHQCASLDQITGKLEQILTRQSAELDVLATTQEHVDYEDLAREELRRASEVQDIHEGLDGAESCDSGALRRIR